MHAVETLVVGAGQAGLAVSRSLTGQGADHVVVERGRSADRWRGAGWDSLRLLPPTGRSRLPAWSYPGPDPDGYMAAPELVGYLEDYAGSFAAPVHENTTVELVEAAAGGLRVVTDQRTWLARNVIVATGTENRAYVPPTAGRIEPEIHQPTAARYPGPGQVPGHGVPRGGSGRVAGGCFPPTTCPRRSGELRPGGSGCCAPSTAPSPTGAAGARGRPIRPRRSRHPPARPSSTCAGPASAP